MLKRFLYSALFIFFLCFLFTPAASSQDLNTEEDPFFDKLNKDVNELIEKHIGSLNKTAPDEEASIKELYNNSSYRDSLQSMSSAIALVERRRIAKDVGVRFYMGYIDNLTNGFEDQGFFYRRAFQTGLDWNLLRDGWLDSRYKAKEYQYHQQIQTLNQTRGGKPNEYSFLYHHISGVFDQAKRIALVNRLSFFNDYLEISKKLYYKKLLLWDDIIMLLAQQAALDNMHQKVAFSDKATVDSNVVARVEMLPVFKINQEQLLIKFYERNNVTDSLNIQLHEDYVLSKYRAVRDISLRPFIRYNYYDYEGLNQTVEGNRDFLSVGLQFSVPLPLRIKENRTLRELTMKEVDLKNTFSASTSAIELKNILSEYDQAYSRYIDLCYKKQVIKEVIRREQVKLNFNDTDYSPITIVKQLNEFFEVTYDVTTVKEQLYLLLLKLNYIIPDADISGFSEKVNYESGVEEVKVSSKSMYVWSSTFSELSNESLVKELKLAKCKKVILSINQDNALKMKAYELNKLLIKANIELHMVIANNKYIYANEESKLIEAVEYLSDIPGIKGIHLDVEPHVLPELKDNRDKYQDMYVDMLKKVWKTTKSKGLKLSVSIPVFYETDKLQKIYSYTDKVYLMAYETPNVDFITRKTKEEIAIDKSKTIIALRTKDFKSRDTMNQFIQQLQSALGHSEFAIHDLKSWATLK